MQSENKANEYGGSQHFHIDISVRDIMDLVWTR